MGQLAAPHDLRAAFAALLPHQSALCDDCPLEYTPDATRLKVVERAYNRVSMNQQRAFRNGDPFRHWLGLVPR